MMYRYREEDEVAKSDTQTCQQALRIWMEIKTLKIEIQTLR